MTPARLLVFALLSTSILTNCILGSAIGFGITTRATASALIQSIKNTMGTRHGQPSEAEQSSITCWGDSLTAGTGAGLHEDFCSVLANVLYRKSFNGGVGGETSAQIRSRMLNRLPGLDSGITIIWAGRNNYREAEDVKHDIATMVSSLPAQANFLVLGIVHGSYPDEEPDELGHLRISKLNSDLLNIYSDRFLDIDRVLMKQAGNVRSDQIHLSALGYSIVAITVANAIIAHSW